jgi:TonB-dependent Receptor Plug Domain.
MKEKKIVYRVEYDENVQSGTVSDALQSVPGVKVDAEGKVSLRSVSEVEIWINKHPSHFDAENLKSYLQQFPASTIRNIEVITNPSSRYTSKTDTGIINIISKDQENAKQYLAIGVLANTNPNLSPRLSYIWGNDKYRSMSI